MNSHNSTKQTLIKTVIPFLALISIQVILVGRISSIFNNLFFITAFLTAFLPAFYNCLESKQLICRCVFSVLIFVVLKSMSDFVLVSFFSNYPIFQNNLYVTALIQTGIDTISLFFILLISIIPATKLVNVKIKLSLSMFGIFTAYTILYYIVNYFYCSIIYHMVNNISSEKTNFWGFVSMLSVPSSLKNLQMILYVLTSLFVFLFSLKLISDSKRQEAHIV